MWSTIQDPPITFGMGMHRQPLARVDQLDQELRVGAPFSHVFLSEVVFRVVLDLIGEEPSRGRMHGDAARVGTRAACRAADPVLGRVAVDDGDGAEVSDALAAKVKVGVRLVWGEFDRHDELRASQDLRAD